MRRFRFFSGRGGGGGGGSRDINVCRVLGGLGVGSDAYFLVILQCNDKKCVYLCIPGVDPPPPPHGFPLDKIMKLDIYIITVIPSSPKPMKNLNEIINCYPFLIKLPNFHPP